MGYLVALFIYFLLGFSIFYYEINRKKYFYIDPITMFNFFYFLVYVIAPVGLLVIGKHLILYDMTYGKFYFGKNMTTPYLVLFGYFAFIAGYESMMRYLLNTKATFNLDIKYSEKRMVYTILIGNFILIFFIYIYASEFGGLLKAIELAQAYRSGAIPWHKYDFVLRFLSINTILLYYTFYKVFLQKNCDYKNSYRVFFIISLSMMIVLTLLYDSRGYFIFQISGLYALMVIYHKNYYLKYMIPTVLFALIFIMYGRILFQSMEYFIKDGFNAFIAAFSQRVEQQAQGNTSIISYFTHAIVSLDASLVHAGYDFNLRYFRDISDAFVNIIPNQLLDIKQTDMRLMDVNTLILQGRAINIILPGILGYFVYAFQVPGIFIGMFINGAIGAILYKLFLRLFDIYKGSIVFFYILSLAYGYFAFRGVPDQVLNENFGLLVVVFILMVNAKVAIYTKKVFSNNQTYQATL